MDAEELHKELTNLGYKSAIKGALLIVKLPLFCSVTVLCGGEVLKCKPKFGYLKRSTASWIECFLFPSVLIFLWVTNANTILLGFTAFMFLIAAIWDVYRYIQTENVVSLVQSIWLGSHNKT